MFISFISTHSPSFNHVPRDRLLFQSLPVLPTLVGIPPEDKGGNQVHLHPSKEIPSTNLTYRIAPVRVRVCMHTQLNALNRWMNQNKVFFPPVKSVMLQPSSPATIFFSSLFFSLALTQTSKHTVHTNSNLIFNNLYSQALIRSSHFIVPFFFSSVSCIISNNDHILTCHVSSSKVSRT